MKGKLTLTQKNKLVNKEIEPDSIYNPFQDIDNNWCISIEEIEQSKLLWIKNIPLIDYKPKETILFINLTQEQI